MSRPLIKRLFPLPVCEACKTQLLARCPKPATRRLTTTGSRPAPINPRDRKSDPATAQPKQAAAKTVDIEWTPRLRADDKSYSEDEIVSQLQRIMNPAAQAVQSRTPSLLSDQQLPIPRIHRLHVYSHKHNTHLTFTRPNAADPTKSESVISVSAGNLGFKKAGRGTFDAAYQLSAYVLGRIQGEGLLPEIAEMELVFRGFGIGREAVTKVILGSEGRMIRPKITALKDSTRLKFGGTRSKKPRRLG